MSKCNILISGFNGWAIRNTLHSGLLEELSQKAQVFLAVRAGSGVSSAELERQVPGMQVLELASAGPDYDAFSRATKRYLRMLTLYHEKRVRKNNETFRVKFQHGYIDGMPTDFRSKATLWASELLHALGWRSGLNRRLDKEIACHPASQFWYDLFRKHKIDTLYLPSSIFSEDFLLASIGRFHGLRVCGSILSWDNLANKRQLPGDYDRYFVWGAEMREELLRYYPHITPEQVDVTGPPQFDWHQQEKWWVSREAFCRNKGLDPERPYILYALCAPMQAPEEQLVLAELAEACCREPLQTWSPQIYARLHPKDDGHRLKTLKSRYPNLIWDQPNPAGDILSKSTGQDEIRNLVNVLRHASVVINIFSTITLDAIVHDKPVINVSWSPNAAKPWPGVLGRYYTHFQPVITSGASPVVETLEQLIEAVVMYLENDTLHYSERAALRRRLCGPSDGMAHQRIADGLLKNY